MLILAADVWARFATGFGVAAAILAVGGAVLLRYQRNRCEFALMREALDRGAASLVAAQPPWLLSLRQGLMTLALGVGLAAVGAAAWWMAEDVQIPRLSDTQPAELLSSPKPRDEQGRLRPEGRLYTIAKSQWERAHTQRTVGLALVGSGGVLILLGAVRIIFSRTEKKVFEQSQISAS